MDLVLDIADDLILDHVWASVLPLSAFAGVPDVVYSSSSVFNASTASKLASPSSWSQILSSLPVPHPPLPALNVSHSAFAGIDGVSAWPRDYVPRQLVSLTVITLIGIHILYFVFASLSYYLIFNHEMMKHPRFLKNQVKLEIQASLRAFPGMMLLTLPWFQAEVMGYSRLYDDVNTYGWGYLFFSIVL